MPRKKQSRLIASEDEVFTAIRYLDPDSDDTIQKHGPALIIYASLAILVLGCVGVIWLCQKLP